MGMEMGQMFWMIFYPTEKYLDESLADPNSVWGQDYTWDAIIFRRELEPDEEYTPLIEQPGLTVDSQSASSIQADEDIEEASFSLSTDVLDFLATYVPFFKTKRTVGEPEMPDHTAVRPKIDAMRDHRINDNNKPFHLVFLSGFAHRFFE